MKVAATADVHCRVQPDQEILQMIQGMRAEADVLVLAGDLTDNGLPEEAEALCSLLTGSTQPVIAILGNHDHEGGQSQEIIRILQAAGVLLLEGTTHEVDGVGFAGIKGFCGGFGHLIIQPFGEAALKTFVRVTIDEAIELEKAIARLETPKKFVVMHYSPVPETLIGEPPELFPFLGSERFANAIFRHGADLVVHGHAHHGSPEGKIRDAIPVYNVSRFVQKAHHERTYQVFEF